VKQTTTYLYLEMFTPNYCTQTSAWFSGGDARRIQQIERADSATNAFRDVTLSSQRRVNTVGRVAAKNNPQLVRRRQRETKDRRLENTECVERLHATNALYAAAAATNA